MHVMLAEDRRLPAAEAHEGHRHRDRHVDAHHAHFDILREAARHIAVPGEDRGAVGEFAAVDQVDRIPIGVPPHHRQDRAEDLLAIDGHVGLDPVEQAAADEIAVLIALPVLPEGPAVHDEPGALGHALVHIAADLGEMLGGDERTHFGGPVRRRPDL